MKFVNYLKHKAFKIKCRVYGQYYWIGPDTEIGVCDECADRNPGSYIIQKKMPVRRLIEEDNIYLCKNHWENARKNPDCVTLEPFLRKIKV